MVNTWSLESILSLILRAFLLTLHSESVLLGDVDDLWVGVYLHTLGHFFSLDSALNILLLVCVVAALEDGEAAASAAATGWAVGLTDSLLCPTLAQRAAKSLAVSHLLHGSVSIVLWILLSVRQGHFLRDVPWVLLHVLSQNRRSLHRWNRLLRAIILVVLVVTLIVLVIESLLGWPTIVSYIAHVPRHRLNAVEVRRLPVKATRVRRFNTMHIQPRARVVSPVRVFHAHDLRPLILWLHALRFFFLPVRCQFTAGYVIH